jgi:hypothetical protein
MASNIRRAAGTQTFVDVLKIWSGIKRPNPAQDLEDFAAGMTLDRSSPVVLTGWGVDLGFCGLSGCGY